MNNLELVNIYLITSDGH